jgi:prepilin-type N-terminal cleavage/methylation domain-containing protein
MDFRRAGLRAETARRGGFSLLELLVVMTIISLLMAASGALFRASGSRSVEPAARMAHGIELARAQAVAHNRNVAIRFERVDGDTHELVMRFLWMRPGQAADQVKEFRRAEHFPELAIAPDIARPQQQATETLPSHALAPAESLVITADGQVLLGTGTSGFPLAADELLPSIRLGVQPTRGGRAVAADRRDVSIVQVQCASGTARVTAP